MEILSTSPQRCDQFLRSPSAINRRSALQLDSCLFQETEDEDDTNMSSFVLSSSAFRSDGLTIGSDYLRLLGVTLTRGLVRPSTILEVHEIIGRGAFSTVRRAIWKRRIRSRECATTPVPFLEKETFSNEETEVINVAIKEWSICQADTSLHASRHRHALLQELRALCTLSAISSALVQLHGAFIQQVNDGHPDVLSSSSYSSPTAIVTVVLEYMDRGSLHDYLSRRQQSLPEPLIAAILYQMLTGLAALHAPERRLLHRDLKPANVLLHSNGCVKLCDFGLTTGIHLSTHTKTITHQRSDPGLSSTKSIHIPTDDDTANDFFDETLMHRTVIGTTQFMAPERLRARPYGRSSDVWSLGLIVWQCLTGQTQPYHDASQPHRSPQSMVDLLVTMEEMTVADLVRSLEHQREQQLPDTKLPSTISAGLQEILSGCLQVDPAKRMPASLMLQSPWFSSEQNIHSVDNAVERVRQYLATYQFPPSST